MEKTELQKRFGQRVILLRQKRGWSQSDLARAMLKDRQAIEKIENGKTNPTLNTIYELSKVLEVSLSELMEI